MRQQVLINAAEATNATKQSFTLLDGDFKGSSLPTLKCEGMGVGDDINLWTWVNGGWQDNGSILDDTVFQYTLSSPGIYAVTITMTTGGPASCELSSTGSNP